MRAIHLLFGAVLLLTGCSDDGLGPLPAPEAESGPSSNPFVIAFASSRGGRSQLPDIYLARADGSGVRRLTLGTSPAWSWDGKSLAFRREAVAWDRAGIYLIRADGSGERFLMDGANPSWGPDGTIAFSAGSVSSGGNIMLIRPNGTGFRRLLPDGWPLGAWIGLHGPSAAASPCEDAWIGPHVDHPVWSPNAESIAFLLTCYVNLGKLFVMNADGSDPRLLFDGYVGRPAWSPDGTRVATAGGAGITVIELASGRQETHRVQGGVHSLDWLPDGRSIVFSGVTADLDPNRQRIFILDLERGSVHRLLPDASTGLYSDFDVGWARGGG